MNSVENFSYELALVMWNAKKHVTRPAKLTMLVQITPSYILANIFHSECSIPFP